MLCIHHLFLALVLQFLPIQDVFSARILGVFLYPSKGQHILGESLLIELSKRGHDVLMISPFKVKWPPKGDNFKHIQVDATHLEDLQYSRYFMQLNVSMWQHIKFGNSEMKYMVASLLEDAKLQEFLNNGEEYDVVISVLFSEALLGISHRVNATTIAFHPTGNNVGYNGLDYLSGNPHPYAYVPNSFTGFSDRMSFWQRFINTYAHLFHALCKHFFNVPMQKSLLKFYFPEAPPLEELVANVDMHLVNSHPSLDYARPQLPNVISIGGFHTQKEELLSVELLKFLDNATDGIVLVTVGGHKKFGDFSVKHIQLLFKAFAKSTHTVVVQYEGPELTNVPKNIRIEAWLPQRAVLSHPHTKLFITHGGRSSVAETIYYGIPIIGLSRPGEDTALIDMMVGRGCGLHFHLDDDLREETLSAGIREVVANASYKKAIKRESEYYNHQEMNPLDRAVYWVEHVVKNEGAKRMKSTPAASLPFYQYFLLDVIFVSLIWLLISSTLLFLSVRSAFQALIRRNRMRNVKHKSV